MLIGKELAVGEGIQLSRELGLLRIGAAVPVLRVADVDFNVGTIIDAMRKARDEGVQVLTFPEMAAFGKLVTRFKWRGSSAAPRTVRSKSN